MTLMTTITNLGYTWMKSIYLWLMYFLTWKSCSFDNTQANLSMSNSTSNFDFNALTPSCYEKPSHNKCIEAGGKCTTTLDGFYVEVAVGVVFSFIWFYFGCKSIRKLQVLPLKSWHVLSTQNEKKEKVSLTKELTNPQRSFQ